MLDAHASRQFLFTAVYTICSTSQKTASTPVIRERIYCFQRVDILKCMLDAEVDKKDLKPDTKGEVALDRIKIVYQ